MQKLVAQMMITLDGLFEGTHQEIDWHAVDDEFNEYAWELCRRVDTILFGRVTYELMASYWPSATALEQDPVTAGLMNNLNKVVFSQTLPGVDWQNSRLVKTDIVTEVRRLKALPGKDLAIFGSSDLCVPLIQANLIDEYHLLVNPVVLGGGKSLYAGLNKRLQLKLMRTKQFNSGLVGLFYQPAATSN
jgi:dihydrofolate reductase